MLLPEWSSSCATRISEKRFVSPTFQCQHSHRPAAQNKMGMLQQWSTIEALHTPGNFQRQFSPEQGAYAANIININVLVHYLGDGFVRLATCATYSLSRQPPTGELLVQRDFAVGAYDEAKYSGACTRPRADVVSTWPTADIVTLLYTKHNIPYIGNLSISCGLQPRHPLLVNARLFVDVFHSPGQLTSTLIWAYGPMMVFAPLYAFPCLGREQQISRGQER